MSKLSVAILLLVLALIQPVNAARDVLETVRRIRIQSILRLAWLLMTVAAPISILAASATVVILADALIPAPTFRVIEL